MFSLIFQILQIPSKQELFQTFLTQQKCKKNTKQMIERVVSRSPNKYTNTRHNVPFSTRLMKRSNVFWYRQNIIITCPLITFVSFHIIIPIHYLKNLSIMISLYSIHRLHYCGVWFSLKLVKPRSTPNLTRHMLFQEYHEIHEWRDLTVELNPWSGMNVPSGSSFWYL